MKKVILLAFAASIFCNLFATTRRVNNNPGVSTAYTTFGAAYTASLNGDTIIVEPSPVSYGDFTVGKSLTIIGNGYGFQGSPIPQFNPYTSSFTDFDVTQTANGSQLIGLEFTNTVDITGSNVVLTRCYFASCSLNLGGAYNIVQSNYFSSAFFIYLDGNNNIFTNNLIKTGGLEVITGAENTLIENNTFYTYDFSLAGFNFNNNTVFFRNNILINWNTANDANIVGHNNLSNFDDLTAYIGPGSNGNYNDVLIENLTTGNPQSSPDISDLQPGPSATNSGYYGNGDDIGAFNDGTGRPNYIVNGIPPFPTVYSLNLGSPDGNNLPVTLGTRTNN